MADDKSLPRILQQQPARQSDQQQQQAGGTDFQRQHGQGESGNKVEGEGSYSATRDYQKNLKDYLDKADVQADAEAAKPRSEAEASELDQAEREARSHSKGEH